MLALILCIVECLVDCLFECHCIVECRLALRVRQGSRAEHSDPRDPRIVPVSPMHSSPASVSASTANSEDGDWKIPTEQRWLATIIAGKETRGVRSLTEKRCFKRIERIAQIAIRLLDEEYADKIDEVEIAMETSLLKEAGKGNREDENNEPMFRDKVVKFGDVPVTWLWEWVRRNSTTRIEDETIQIIMRRGPKKFRSAISSVTGAE